MIIALRISKERKLPYQTEIGIIAWIDMGFILDEAINVLMRFRIRNHWGDEYVETPGPTGTIVSYWNINSNTISCPQLRIIWYLSLTHHCTESNSRDALIYAEEQFRMYYTKIIQNVSPFVLYKWRNSIMQ